MPSKMCSMTEWISMCYYYTLPKCKYLCDRTGMFSFWEISIGDLFGAQY